MAQGDTLRRQMPAPEPPTADVKAQAGASPEPTPSPATAAGERAPSQGRPMLPSGAQPGPSAPPRLTAPSESIAASAERRVEALGRQGLPTGTGKQIGPLFFDPEGADFTDGVEHLRREIYRNWIVPQSAMFGFGTHADFEFVVERDGRVSAANLAKSSGVSALDRAAQNALIASRPLPLPADFKSPRLVLQISFVYNAERQG
jgi:TonB family protein